MIRRPPRSTQSRSSAASDVYKRQILLRSVKNGAGPIVAALRSAGIPYLIKGMNRLFETPEIESARAIFYYLTDEIDRDALKQTWLDADLGLIDADIDTAISWLDQERTDSVSYTH